MNRSYIDGKLSHLLLDKYGDEWDFLMGSSYHPDKTENIEGSPRRVYWATMSTYVMYNGPKRFSRHPVPSREEGYLHITSAEKHFSFDEAINDLAQKMEAFVGG